MANKRPGNECNEEVALGSVCDAVSPDTSAYTDYRDAPCKELCLKSLKERILDMVQRGSSGHDTEPLPGAGGS
ncbi:GL23818 [Drosophila persimilis]|uniref:GL23818 n=1 Tax=Drosophila persimilis TaxID=7234 RepID=B4G674_DROPE|nr:GL23818 [Drosophila persimilis]